MDDVLASAAVLAPPTAPYAAWADRLRAAMADGCDVRIRGGGTKDFYGDAFLDDRAAAAAAAAGPGDDRREITLDTREAAGIVSYEPSELVVTARAGTPLAELEAVLAGKGQRLAFEPPRFAPGGTVGGMVAAGLGGPSRAGSGAVRDHVLGAVLLNGRAELLTFGGQVMKNVAGYDVSRVLPGSLGVLGVIAEVSLKVLPVAPAEATLRFQASQADALRLLHAWGGQPLPLDASCWSDEQGGSLRLRLRGAVAAVQAAIAHLGGELQAQEEAVDAWAGCRDQSAAWFTDSRSLDLWRLSVPQTAPVLAWDGDPPWVEWHGAQRWYHASPGDVTAGERLRAMARTAGGHAMLFRPASGAVYAGLAGADSGSRDASRRTGRMAPLPPALERIHRALKLEFDPHGLFNRGRLNAGW
ncbi:MAG: glycolate oxidase subunit GlcE [Comamonadaceae bacterium]|nr:MAG: glycolate oxidase subunit GlcE [Comamonadaceae bacterium]